MLWYFNPFMCMYTQAHTESSITVAEGSKYCVKTEIGRNLTYIKL